MNEELDYAEMLEIPTQTVSVEKKERKKRREEIDLGAELVDKVNERMETEEDPAYAESTPILREENYSKRKLSHKIVVAEFIAVCALCATIFLTNIFLTDSAINVFVRGLFRGTEQASVDTRVYSDFTLSSPVNRSVETEIAVSASGVLSFTEKCSVYSPCDGEVTAVNGNAESGYTVEIKHSENFSTLMSGLDSVYLTAGDRVKSNIPLGFSNGEGEIRVMFYSGGTLISGCVVDGTELSWS